MVDIVVALSGCVCPYSVCVLLSLSQVVAELSVWLVLRGAPHWHWAAGVNRGCTMPKGLPRGSLAPDPQGQSVRRCCSVSVYLCCCSSSIILLEFKIIFNWWFSSPSVTLTYHPSPKSTSSPLSLNNKVHSAHASFYYITWLGCL